MILTEDLEIAFSTEKISDTDVEVLVDEIRKSITEYSIRVAQTNVTKEFVEATARLFATDLKKCHTHIRVGEVTLAVRLLSQSSEKERVSVNTFTNALDVFVYSKERARFKEVQADKSNQKRLEVKTQWTTEEHVEKMRDRYIENLNLVDKGQPVRDLGGLLFAHMLKEEIIEMTIEDEEEVLASLHGQRKLDPLNTRVRELIKCHLRGENAILPVVQEYILTKYFKLEVAMRLEARKLKA